MTTHTGIVTTPELVRIAPRSEVLMEGIHDWNDGRQIGLRVRRVGSILIDIEMMMFNFRVVFRDAVAPLGLDMTGHGWCYDRDNGLAAVADWVCEWELDDLNSRIPHPPGPWIKAVHSGVYREPGIGQSGSDGLIMGRDGRPRIVCPNCGRSSGHPDDIANRYCGNCHQFHDQMVEGPS